MTVTGGLPEDEAPVSLEAAHVAALLDLSADAIIALSPDEHILYWNRGAADMLGWSAAEVLGRRFDFLLPDEEAARGELKWIHDTTLTRGSIRDHESRRQRKDGTIMDVSLTRTAVLDEGGAVLGFTAIIRDISDRKRLERSLLASERLATAGRVAAGVAHEIGAPLTAISMTVESLLRRPCPTCNSADQMQVLRSQTDRIARLARQLVDLAKPAAVTMSPLQVNEAVSMAAGLLRSHFEHKVVELEVRLAPSLPLVCGDGAQLQQVVLNLLLRANHSAVPGAGKVEISTRLRDPGAVQIVVSDNGPGIPKADLPHLFTPFSGTGGAGLGLAIAAQIVQAHRGTIEAVSVEKGGATYSVTLPVDTSRG